MNKKIDKLILELSEITPYTYRDIMPLVYESELILKDKMIIILEGFIKDTKEHKKEFDIFEALDNVFLEVITGVTSV